MNGSNQKTTRIVIILMAVACVLVMALFAFGLMKEEEVPSGNNGGVSMTIQDGPTSHTISQTDIAA